MTWDEERVATENNTPGRVGKLLFFKLTGRDSFEDGEARLSGARDGKWCRKFRRIYRVDGIGTDRLAAGRASGERRCVGGLPVLESLAEQAAGERRGAVETERHRAQVGGAGRT